MDAVESQGFRCDCRTFALNSYENRVYQVGIEEGQPVIAKFYRPGRWSDDQIVEEHRFCFELAEHELPVVAPWANPAGESLFHYGGFRFALYPRQGGHAPEFDNLDNLLILGRMLGRIHRIGAVRPFHAPAAALDSRSFGHDSVALIAERFIPGRVPGQLPGGDRAVAGGHRRDPDRAPVRSAASAPMATAMPAISSGATVRPISSISTMPAWRRRCRTSG